MHCVSLKLLLLIGTSAAQLSLYTPQCGATVYTNRHWSAPPVVSCRYQVEVKQGSTFMLYVFSKEAGREITCDNYPNAVTVVSSSGKLYSTCREGETMLHFSGSEPSYTIRVKGLPAHNEIRIRIIDHVIDCLSYLGTGYFGQELLLNNTGEPDCPFLLPKTARLTVFGVNVPEGECGSDYEVTQGHFGYSATYSEKECLGRSDTEHNLICEMNVFFHLGKPGELIRVLLEGLTLNEEVTLTKRKFTMCPAPEVITNYAESIANEENSY